ncbi:LysR substrate-binding domain-containing protein [Pararhizobium sp. A13]|uniref:LysR family transcriptional regulator n=1 Tax=Pararhizobium sp. A13 TaxID=3133975 RepID=UPI00311B0DC7
MDKLTNMRAFTKVVAHGSFTEAAKEMRLSRSAVSKYVIDLEADLGVQLLNRTTQSVSPTDAGQSYFERCISILAEIEEAELALSHSHAAPRGLLRVNAPMSFGTMLLGHAVSDFMERYPELQTNLALSDEQLDTVQEGFDVTVRITESPPFNLIARKIAPVPRILCASPHYLDRAGMPKHPKYLRDHNCLSYGYLATGMQWKLTGADGEHTVQVPWTLCSNNGEILRDAAVDGRGIALLPTFIVSAQVRDGSLLRILSDYEVPEMSVYALYPPTRYIPVKLRVFIDFLVARFAGRPDHLLK